LTFARTHGDNFVVIGTAVPDAADKLRMLETDAPNMQVLDPLRIGQNVQEVIGCDLGTEMTARVLYQEGATYCHQVKDYVTRDLFESLMKDESIISTSSKPSLT
jgi:bacterioferritin (cytochrome b1)